MRTHNRSIEIKLHIFKMRTPNLTFFLSRKTGNFVFVIPIRVLNLLTIVPGYIRFLVFYSHIKYELLNNQKDLQIVYLHFIKSD